MPPPDVLRALAAAQGVTVGPEDLERVSRFLAGLMPAWEELEALLEPEAVPLGLPIAGPGGAPR